MNVMSRVKTIALMLAVVIVVIGLLFTLNMSIYEATARSRNARPNRIWTSANLEVYSDSACTQSLTSIDWGTVSSGDSVTKTLYLKNQGRTSVRLSLITVNWSPRIAYGLIVVNWNREGATLVAGQTLSATLTLSASPTASGFTTFGVNVVILGQGYRNYY